MPIYSYKCTNGEKIFDKFQRPGTNGQAKCEFCDSDAVRIFSPVGIIFKGSGFYKTDYGSSTKASSNSKADIKTTDKKKESESQAKKPKKEEAKPSKSAS